MEQFKSGNGWISKLATVLTALVLAMSFLPISVLGTQEAYAAESGTLSDSVSWSLDDSGNLTIYPTNGVSGSFNWNNSASEFPWVRYVFENPDAVITGVVVDGSVSASGSLAQMFEGLTDVTSFDLSGLNTDAVTDMHMMFHFCRSVQVITLPESINTSNVENMAFMFQGCDALTTIHFPQSFDTSRVVDMSYMFSSCPSLESLDLSMFDNSSLQYGGGMFMTAKTPNLRSVILPESFSFLGDDIANDEDKPCLPTPDTTSGVYTGYWVRGTDLTDQQSTEPADNFLARLFMPEKAYAAPAVDGPFTAEQLRDNWDGTTMAGEWHWEVASGQSPVAAPTITVNKTINVPASVDLTGLTYTFDFQAAAPVANEPGAFAVPNGVDIPTVTLIASNSTLATGNDSVRTISGTVNLPDPNLFGHAGVYAYTVSEAVSGASASDSWDNDLSVYKVRLYVVNDGQGGLAYADGTNSNSTDTMTIEVVNDIDGNVPAAVQKTSALDFTNTYDKTVPFQVKKLVAGDYANRTHKFSFDLTLDFPDYVTSGTYAYTTSYGTNGSVTVSNGTATISGFQLAADETLDFASLPVGTVYTVVESTPSEGVNNYTPSATYTYSGIGAANSGYETATNSVAAGTAGATYTVNRTDGAAQNLNTILGAGSGNRVDVTNTLVNPPSPTGVLVQTLPFAAIVAIPAILGTALYLTRRRDEDQL